MLLFNFWHLSILLAGIIVIASIAVYANAKKNYVKVFRNNFLLLGLLCITSFGFIPELPDGKLTIGFANNETSVQDETISNSRKAAESVINIAAYLENLMDRLAN